MCQCGHGSRVPRASCATDLGIYFMVRPISQHMLWPARALVYDLTMSKRLAILLPAAILLHLGHGLAAPTKVEEGAAALVRGDASQAVAAYTEALKDPALPNDRRGTILTDRGVAYARLGQPKLALEDFNRAVQLFPEYAAAYNNRGSLLLALGLPKEAVKDFNRAVTLAPGYAAAYNNRAGALLRLGQQADALRDFTKAIQLMPTSAAPLNGRGRVFLALGRPHAAIRDFSRAVNADARFALAYRSRAEAKLEVGRPEEAIEDLSRAIAFDVENTDFYVLRGYAYLATDNTASALKDFSRAIEIEPNNAAGYEGRGLAHGLSEAFEEALADLNRAIDLDPRSAVAFAYRAYVYKQSGQPDVGQKDIDTALKLDPNRAEVQWAKGEIDEAAGRTDEAIADHRRALAAKPNYKPSMSALERLGAPISDKAETVIAGLGIDPWKVVVRNGAYFAVSDSYPRISVPLEMAGPGQPRLLEWELKKPPLKGIGVLRFYGGSVPGPKGPEEVEMAAIIDTAANSVVSIQPHRQGDKVATWTWDEGRVVIASVDGVTDEFFLRTPKKEAAPARRVAEQPSGIVPWAPWAQPWGVPSGTYDSKPRRSRKPKTLFDLLFN